MTDTDASTLGTSLLYAYALGTNANTATVNTVPFAPWASGSTSPSGNITTSFAAVGTGFGSGTAPFSGLSASYRNILNDGFFSGVVTDSITLNNLTIGNRYLVQFWVNDSRGSGCPADGNFGQSGQSWLTRLTLAGAVGQYAIGTFEATAATQTIEIANNGSGSQLNAIQVRVLASSGSPQTYQKHDHYRRLGRYQGIGRAGWCRRLRTSRPGVPRQARSNRVALGGAFPVLIPRFIKTPR